MILIADSGSTKTTWMELESGNKVVTEGLNPYFTTDETFLAACNVVLQHFNIQNLTLNIFFYGAGCGLPAQRERVATLLTKAFGTSDVRVETDMLGACRAVCGRDKGLVGILGTGSNACYYDGEKITLQAVSTGYILGDHGSANHVGRMLLQDYLPGKMPTEMMDLFREAYPMSREQFLEAVYHQPNANRFLASLAKFAVEHQDNAYCGTAIIYESLCQWNDYQLDDIRWESDCNRLSLVGGYAARLMAPLLQFVKDHELNLCSVIADPIDGLKKYHTETP